MDAYAEYCPTRGSLEQHTVTLIARLSALTTHLTKLIGQDHNAFLAAKAECQQTREDLANSRRLVHDHRIVHGC